jgi:hypothetical protein
MSTPVSVSPSRAATTACASDVALANTVLGEKR